MSTLSGKTENRKLNKQLKTVHSPAQFIATKKNGFEITFSNAW